MRSPNSMMGTGKYIAGPAIILSVRTGNASDAVASGPVDGSGSISLKSDSMGGAWETFIVKV